MRTIAIIGTDWSGPDPAWVRQPFLDGGRLGFDRMRIQDWQNVFYELGDLARVDCLAVGFRGAGDIGAVKCLPIARAAYDAAHPQPTLTMWCDTVGLPDISHAAGEGPFDFANPQHIRWGWERYAQIIFDMFRFATWERTPSGKVLLPWWGIETNTGHGFINQQHAQRLLDFIDRRLVDMGLGGADHIVDRSWLELVPNLNCYGVHNWFNPWKTPPSAYSIRTHNGVTVGVTVPSFYRLINPDGNADTIRQSLAEMRAKQCDYAIIESGTNFVEGAELMRDASGNTSKLDAVREHIALTKGDPMDAVTTKPLLDWVLFDNLVQGVAVNRFALRWNEANGDPDPNSDRVFSLQPDGTIQTRALNQVGEWESSRPIDDSDREIVWVTENAEKTQRAMKVFGLKRNL